MRHAQKATHGSTARTASRMKSRRMAEEATNSAAAQSPHRTPPEFRVAH
jgi:hypothetical protein